MAQYNNNQGVRKTKENNVDKYSKYISLAGIIKKLCSPSFIFSKINKRGVGKIFKN